MRNESQSSIDGFARTRRLAATLMAALCVGVPASAGAFSFANTAYGTGYAFCFGSPRGFSLGTPNLVEGRAQHLAIADCSESSGSSFDETSSATLIDMTTEPPTILANPHMGVLATDTDASGSNGASSMVAEGLSVIGPPASSVRGTFRVIGTFHGDGDNTVVFQISRWWHDAGGALQNDRAANLSINLIDPSTGDLFVLLQDATHTISGGSVISTTMPGPDFAFDVTFDVFLQGDSGFFAELFAAAFLLSGNSTDADALHSAVLTSMEAPSGGTVVLASGQTFGGTAVPEPSSVLSLAAGLILLC